MTAPLFPQSNLTRIGSVEGRTGSLERRPAPAPTSTLEWFWVKKTTTQNRNSGALGGVLPWDTSDSSGSAFDMSDVTVNGTVGILKTGVYSFAAELHWSTTAVPSVIQLEVYAGTMRPSVGTNYCFFSQFGPTGMLSYPPDLMNAGGDLIVTALHATAANNYLRLTSGQQSGATKTMDGASIFGVRHGNV